MFNRHHPEPSGSSQTTFADIEAISARIAQTSSWLVPLKNELRKSIIGQDHLIERLLVGLLAGGHVLVEGLPGLAKTLTIKTIARAIDSDFRRIQFTPDMLPADIVGTELYNQRDTVFEVKKGPIFASIILADEINRAPAKVQSALLEAMQEKQVTIGETTFRLPGLFMVMATQNPIEQEGTYPLPEAQVDRFMLKVTITYPSRDEERRLLDLWDQTDAPVGIAPVAGPDAILASREVVNTIYIDEKIKDYIVALVCASRDPSSYGIGISSYIETGASPRATLNLKAAARCLAYLQGRGYVTPDDVKQTAFDVMRHRIRVSYEAEAESITSEDLIRNILDTIAVP
jgi:MoxR-like ATPase